MSRTINISDSATSYPVSFDDTNSRYASANSSYPASNAFTDSSSTTYAQYNITTGSGAETYLYFNLDFDDIPNGATIDSVTCSVKAYINTTNSSRITTRQVQLIDTNGTSHGSVTINNSTNAQTMSVSGSWTAASVKGSQILLHVKRGTSNTTSTYNVRLYGATVTVNYSINGIAYTTNAASNINEVTITPATQEQIEGEDVTVRIDASSIDDIVVTDNDVDVTDLLERHNIETGGTINAVPQSYTTSGTISGTRYQSTVGCGVDNPSSQTGNDYSQSSGSTATIYYTFNFSDIPNNATITSMTVQAYGHLESTSNSNEKAELNVYSGTTAKGTATSFTSTSSTTVTVPAGNWTVSELKDDPRVGFTIGYYGGLVTGITWTVEYSTPSSGSNYYWTYTISNISADHIILVDEAGVFIPPEEDPTYEYYPITVSSINATTNPHSGTTRVVEGSNQTITITPSDPQLTLALDNGVDITSQLVGGIPTNTYTVTTEVSGASYGFNLNSSTGYYVSTNSGISKSASVARLNLDFESDCLVTITYINYAEADYDYGMFGKLDTAVATDGLTASSGGSTPSDSTSNYQLAKCSNSSSAQTITYEVSAGEHFIDIKYGKDDASDGNNDSLQWKVTSIEPTSAGGDYTYTLTNITEKHSLIFVFGDVTYYFVNSSGTNCKLFPDGSQVKLPGDSYQIKIVPDNITDEVTLTDNNVAQTLEKLEGVDKHGNSVVSYTYELSNIQATHNLVITAAAVVINQLYIKNATSWIPVVKIYVKQNGTWVEQRNTYLSDNNIHYLKKG